MTQGSFAERARQQQRRNGPACQMGTVLGKMPPEYVTEVNAALADLTINGTTIARLLTDDGYKVGADTVRRHRNNVCEHPASPAPMSPSLDMRERSLPRDIHAEEAA